jgi:hypothetical protein
MLERILYDQEIEAACAVLGSLDITKKQPELVGSYLRKDIIPEIQKRQVTFKNSFKKFVEVTTNLDTALNHEKYISVLIS